MIEGRGAGKRFLRKGTPRARPNICPTQVPPDLGNSLTTYSPKGPDKRCTIPFLTRAFVSSRVLEGKLMAVVPRCALSPISSLLREESEAPCEVPAPQEWHPARLVFQERCGKRPR